MAWLLIATTAQAITCDVPSVTHPIIQSAIGDSGCATINLTAAFYGETVTISRTVTIQGGGVASTTVDGGGSGSVFTIQSGLVVTLTDMTIANGDTTSIGGGGINNDGSTVIINAATIAGNAGNVQGGGIRNDEGRVEVTNSTLSDNGTLYGGGIYNLLGTVLVTNSTFSGNAAQSGGGIFNDDGDVTVINSTLSGNETWYGGGIFTCGTLTVTNSTLSENVAHDGGGIYNLCGTYTVAATNSMIANNLSTSGGECSGFPITSLGHNLTSDDNCNLVADGDLPNTDPLLGPLQDNGGPTWTHALHPGSSATDAGDKASCPATDQRGISRPQGSTCDIGAYELDYDSTYLPFLAKNS